MKGAKTAVPNLVKRLNLVCVLFNIEDGLGVCGRLPAEFMERTNTVNEMSEASLEDLLMEVRACRKCEQSLPLGPRPVLQAGSKSRILIVGQAPGAKVHETGIPWDDASGERLRSWLAMEPAVFYDASRIAIIPMGFCYPGRGPGGDNPPRRECSQVWFDSLLHHLPDIRLTLLVGQYAQRHFLGNRRKGSLTGTVKSWQEYAPDFIPLPHPSPRNQAWFKRHQWFESEVVPMLQQRIAALLGPE